MITFGDIFGHIALRPQDAETEKLTLHKVHETFFFLFGKRIFFRHFLDEGVGSVAAHFQDELFVIFAVDGIVNMINDFRVHAGKAEGDLDALSDGIDGVVFEDEVVEKFFEDDFEQIGHVFEMIIKGISADPAFFDEHFYGDSVERLLVEQPDKRFLDLFLRIIRQNTALLFVGSVRRRIETFPESFYHLFPKKANQFFRQGKKFT